MSAANSLPLEVTVQQVQALREADSDFLLLDCRERDEFETARIDGSLLIPMGELPERIAELEPHRERSIVVHCHHGGRSMRVTQWLREQGYSQTQNMAGGIDAWSQQIDDSVPRY
jgi:rhodanese-related sulfurtransferase